ncbi:hypothetical protein C1645_829743 [Glomus cerebriforme]|uniref:Uncharacterized protein n=1 Tax=Glomus cerebriforme TaxID=658196 RepID=A0A397SND5_9GLOM|nr:hypothetical protein C1645_829743 [Glomus cerebriforme]
MAKIKQIKPSDRKKLYFHSDKKEPCWDPTWCYPEKDEIMIIAAWDSWDTDYETFKTSSSPVISVLSIDSSSGTQEFSKSNNNIQTTKLKGSTPIQTFNTRSRVDVETSQCEDLIKFDEKNVKKDINSIIKELKSLSFTSSDENIHSTKNSSNNMVQPMEAKEHSREYEYNKNENSQPVDVLIDLDGLDDWLNKVNIPSKDSQLEQSWCQTDADKARKNTSNMNDKVNYKDLLEFDLLMQK